MTEPTNSLSTGPSPLPRMKILIAYASVSLLVIVQLVSCNGGEPKSAEPTVTSEVGNTHDAQFAHCLSQLQAGEFDEAMEPCKRAVELDPDNSRARHNLGYAYRKTSEYDMAEAMFLQVLEREPANALTLYELGSTYAEAGRTEEARAKFLEVLQVDPNHGWAQSRLAELSGS